MLGWLPPAPTVNVSAPAGTTDPTRTSAATTTPPRMRPPLDLDGRRARQRVTGRLDERGKRGEVPDLGDVQEQGLEQELQADHERDCGHHHGPGGRAHAGGGPQVPMV